MKLETETTPYKQLTREVIQPINGRSAAFAVGGTILLLFLVNWAVLWLEQAYPYNRGYWVVRQKWELLQELSAPVDWLIVGDSTGNQGLVPDVLEDQLGGTAINLNTEGNMAAADDVWMLETYIAQFGPPAHVLVIHSYDVWDRGVEPIYLSKTPLEWNSWQTYTPALSLTAQEKFNLFLGRYVPLYADNVSLGKLVRGRMYLQRSIFEKRYFMQEDGFMPLLAVPGSANIGVDVEEHLDFVAENTFVLSDINREALTQLIDLAEAYNIEIYLAFGPMYEGLVQNKDIQVYLGEVQAELQTFADQSEHVHLLETRATFPADQMENVDHVILEAANTYTNLIAAEIEGLQK